MGVEATDGRVRAACETCSWRGRRWHPFGAVSTGGREQTDGTPAAMAEAVRHRETAHRVPSPTKG